jgi:hypothetical protein
MRTHPPQIKVSRYLPSLLTALSTAILLSSCAVGPLVSHETARTVGNSNHEILGGYGQAGFAFKWNYGVSENFDIGLHWESLSIGVRAKYAFINSKDSWSFAAALGTGSSVGGSHTYIDLITSTMAGSWEPYGTIRLVKVKTDPMAFRDKDTGQVAFTISSAEYDYGQALLGTRYWFNTHWHLSLEASSLFAVRESVKFGSNALIGAALGYRF